MIRSLATIAFLALGTAAAFAAQTPAQIAEQFCTLRGGSDQALVLALLTTSLKAEIAEAQRKNDEIQAARPDEKPPMGDGVPYQSFPDSAPVCKVGEISTDGTEVDVDYVFPDTPAANWSDRLKLVREGGALLIDNVYYGDTEFQDSLRRTLKVIFEP